MKIKIIIKPSFSKFRSDEKLKGMLDALGYENIFDIEARTDEKTIKFIEDTTNKKGRDVQYKGAGQWSGCLSIAEVDTSKVWTITEYNGAESIVYLEPSNKELNYYEIKEN